MAFRGTIVRLAKTPRGGHLKNWWGKYYPVEGRVTQHLSPYEQDVTLSLFKNLPAHFTKSSTKLVTEAWFGFIFLVSVFSWGNYEHKRVAHTHRP